MRQLLIDDNRGWDVPLWFPIRPPKANLPVEEWRVRGAQLLREHKARTDAARARFRRAEQILLDWLLVGEVTAALRRHEGGPLEPIPNTYWNSENIGSRFQTGKLYPDKPFRTIESNIPHDASWIFIDSISLNRLMSRSYAEVDKPVTDDKTIYLSDLFEFAIEMAHKYRVHLKNQLKITELKKLIKPDIISRFGGDAAPGTLSAIATVLRDFEARKGTASTLRGTDQSAKLRPVRVFPASDSERSQ